MQNVKDYERDGKTQKRGKHEKMLRGKQRLRNPQPA
jgi:hypothetical protein